MNQFKEFKHEYSFKTKTFLIYAQMISLLSTINVHYCGMRNRDNRKFLKSFQALLLRIYAFSFTFVVDASGRK